MAYMSSLIRYAGMCMDKHAALVLVTMHLTVCFCSCGEKNVFFLGAQIIEEDSAQIVKVEVTCDLAMYPHHTLQLLQINNTHHFYINIH